MEARASRELHEAHEQAVRENEAWWVTKSSTTTTPRDVSRPIITTNPYPQWRPLSSSDHFRLLQILPGTEPVIHCSLEEFPLTNAPTYKAISYCWTTSSGTETILCDGVEVQVTRSLYDALSAVRHSGRAVRVWVDALCISQTGVEERSRQIQIIGKIFQGAEMVWICLGDTCEKTRGALGIIKLAIESRQLISKAQDLNVVLNLFEKPWFERLWIVQEVCQAKEAWVVLGTETLPWHYISKLCADLEDLLTRSPIAPFRASENIAKVSCLESIRSRFLDPGKNQGLLDLVFATSRFKVKDPRDKIFALVGLAKDVTDADWEVGPDYASSVEDVYHRFAIWNLAKRGDLRLLSFPRDPATTSTLLMPSWVPNLSISDQSRIAALLAVSDEPNDPRVYMSFETSEVGPVLGFTPATKISVRTPDAQWRCADGIFRPVRPVLKSWYIKNMREENFYGLRRVAFSGNNKILHLVGREVDKLEILASTPASESSTADSRALLFLMASSYRVWNEEEATQLCRIIHDAVVKRTAWLSECASIASKARSISSHGSPLTWRDFTLTLCCRRLLSGLPNPNFSDSQLVDSMGLASFIEGSNKCIPADCDFMQTPRVSQDYDMRNTRLYKLLRSGHISVRPGQSMLEFLLVDEHHSLSKHFYPAMIHWSRARRFASTSHGRLANIPIGAQAGDIVCIILGGSVPYVLRPQKDGYYSLVGECYLHGLMHGEAESVLQSRSRYTQEFAIR